MTIIVATVCGLTIEHETGDAGALNWRWWRRSLGDYGYRDERCICLGYVEAPAGFVLIAYERDGRLDLCTPHMLFPIADAADALPGAEEYANRVIAQHAREPVLQ